ncbi:MAG: class I SAM-dependent methyltransferase, partial [Candidatus Binatia bacterium]
MDYEKLRNFLGKTVDDVGTATLGALSYIGDRLDLFKTLAACGPVTIEELAKKTRLNERYLREWLNAMTSARYVEYRPETRQYYLPPEHAAVLADETSPFFVGGFLEMIVPSVMQAPKLVRAFRNGKGVPQSAYPPEMFEAIERGTAPWYRHKLAQEWIPTMPDVQAKLAAGGSFLDVGCGSGRAAIAIAKAFPKATVRGYDN